MNRYLLTIPLLLFMLSGCTTTIIDEVRNSYVGLANGDKVVVIGRRHRSEYETELDFVECVGKGIAEGSNISVVPEQDFIDSLYPWFEPRTAPVRISGMAKLLERSDVEARLVELGIRHIVWIDGSTRVTSKSGSLACGASLTGASCLGFITWDSSAEYEAAVWDYKNSGNIGRVSADAKGTSYMPAIVIPIPLIARVKASACKGLGGQLKTFLMTDKSGELD